ncbi:hypothetical protein F4803DRAFT_97989 [Xylaria telfairii]|nr:hypothetical protein F4803DRAFT_97989 [Xylaria telfairii]
MQTSIALISLALAGFSYGSPTAASKRYVSGSCSMHVTQWQKNENGVGGSYEFDIVIKDAIGAIIGGVNRLAIENFSSEGVTSELPYVLVVSTGGVDSDPVQFAYAGGHFSTSDGCSTGGYDSGRRQMDCGFHC